MTPPPPPPPLAIPVLTVLDSFNRGNANTLGGNWRQFSALGSAAIRVNNNQASDNTVTGNAYWNAASFGTQQAAAFTFANSTLNNAALYLKASGNYNLLGTYASAIRVRYTTNNGGQVVVETTTNAGINYTTAAALTASFATSDRLTALVDAAGKVTVWKTAGTVSSVVGSATTTFTGAGSIGMSLPANARVDDFAGGNVQ